MYLHDKVRVYVDFYQQDDDGEWILEDPDTVDVTIVDGDDLTIHGPEVLGDEHRISTGKYFYDWVADTTGDLTFIFEAEFDDGATETVERHITVTTPIVAESDADVLGLDYELEFSTEVDLVYGDIEEIQSFFDDASIMSVLDIVVRFSREVDKLDIKSPADNELVLEYVKFATLCELSRIYDPVMGGEGSTLRLGDLSYSIQSTSSNRVNRGSASSWCELALAIRRDLFTARPSQFVKGARVKDPMPKRHIKRAAYWWWQDD